MSEPNTMSKEDTAFFVKTLWEALLKPDWARGDLGEMAAAFDELVDGVKKFVAGHPSLPTGLFNSSAIVTDVLAKIKATSETDKSTRLCQIATIVRAASFIAGDQPIIAEVKAVLDTALKNHNVTI